MWTEPWLRGPLCVFASTTLLESPPPTSWHHWPLTLSDWKSVGQFASSAGVPLAPLVTPPTRSPCCLPRLAHSSSLRWPPPASPSMRQPASLIWLSSGRFGRRTIVGFPAVQLRIWVVVASAMSLSALANPWGHWCPNRNQSVLPCLLL